MTDDQLKQLEKAAQGCLKNAQHFEDMIEGGPHSEDKKAEFAQAQAALVRAASHAFEVRAAWGAEKIKKVKPPPTPPPRTEPPKAPDDK